MSVKPAHVEDVHREYLTFDELQRLAKTECPYPVLKDAFLFSCLTGMRWSDINKLTWAEVQEFDGTTRIVFRQKKTKGLEYLDITDQAVRYMGQRSEPDERVFIGLKYSAWHNLALREWCLKADITKHITFHGFRRSYAVIQISLGTDIYTVSKMLTHKNVSTTQIYADLVNVKKRETANKISLK